MKVQRRGQPLTGITAPLLVREPGTPAFLQQS